MTTLTTTTTQRRRSLFTLSLVVAVGSLAAAGACGPLCALSPPCEERDEAIDDDGDGCVDRCLPPPSCDPLHACNAGDRPLTGDEGCGDGGVCYDRQVCDQIVTCSGPAYTQCSSDDACIGRCNTEDFCDPPFEIDGNWECLGRCQSDQELCLEAATCDDGSEPVRDEDDCDERGCHEVSACGGTILCKGVAD